MKLTLVVLIVLGVLAMSTDDAAAGTKPVCDAQESWYIGGGPGINLQDNALEEVNFEVRFGYQWCNGVKMEFEHESLLTGDDKVYDLEGNKFRSDQNGINLQWEKHWY